MELLGSPVSLLIAAMLVPSKPRWDMIREAALPMGWVDVKVCTVDAVWSGLKLMIRKELR